MKNKKIKLPILATITCLFLLSGCEKEDKINAKPIFETEIESTDPLDIYLKREFRDPFGSVFIYKFVDKFIDPSKLAVPPKRDVIIPISELIKQAWIKPYNVASDRGEDFLKDYFPAEIVILGSPLFNGDGTITLGIADSGVRVTLTQANNYTEDETIDRDRNGVPDRNEWILQTFRTLHHEFAHIIDQNFNFEVESFFNISGDDYTSPGSWSLETQNTAIGRGMVTPYGTSAVGEDFAELISYIITTPPAEFEATYFTPEDCSEGTPDERKACDKRNVGRLRIQEKYDVVIEYMKEDVGIDLLVLRDEFLKSLN